MGEEGTWRRGMRRRGRDQCRSKGRSSRYAGGLLGLPMPPSARRRSLAAEPPSWTSNVLNKKHKNLPNFEVRGLLLFFALLGPRAWSPPPRERRRESPQKAFASRCPPAPRSRAGGGARVLSATSQPPFSFISLPQAPAGATHVLRTRATGGALATCDASDLQDIGHRWRCVGVAAPGERNAPSRSARPGHSASTASFGVVSYCLSAQAE